MYVKLNGEMVYLWRAVGHEGEVLESYVTHTRAEAAALTFVRKALKRHGSPEAHHHRRSALVSRRDDRTRLRGQTSVREVGDKTGSRTAT